MQKSKVNNYFVNGTIEQGAKITQVSMVRAICVGETGNQEVTVTVTVTVNIAACNMNKNISIFLTEDGIYLHPILNPRF